jgi:diguanylate cyclase (GGDEF)-like protein
MADVDHFKRYNDTFGHTAGDVILKGVAEALRAVAPSGSAVARFGGEEFAVLLPRVPRAQAGEIAERIRRRVEQQVKSVTGAERRAAQAEGAGRRGQTEPGDVTVSIGVASFPDDAQADMELIRVADQRLYQAKHAGRNLVCSS